MGCTRAAKLTFDGRVVVVVSGALVVVPPPVVVVTLPLVVVTLATVVVVVVVVALGARRRRPITSAMKRSTSASTRAASAIAAQRCPASALAKPRAKAVSLLARQTAGAAGARAWHSSFPPTLRAVARSFAAAHRRAARVPPSGSALATLATSRSTS